MDWWWQIPKGVLPIAWRCAGLLETTKIHSIVGLLKPEQALVTRRPFRTPQHTRGSAAIPGSGTASEIVKTVENKGDYIILELIF